MANKEKLQQVWEFIKNHRELLNMDHWIRPLNGNPNNIDYAALESRNYAHCGTTACLAGWTALLNGWIPVFDGDGLVKSPDGTHTRSPEIVAREILELNRTEAISLFYCLDYELDAKIERILNAS